MKTLQSVIVLLLLPTVFVLGQQNPFWDSPTADQADSLKILIDQDIEKEMRMQYCNLLGKYYQEVQTDSALFYFKKQLFLAQELGSILWEAEGLRGIGYVYSLMGNYPGAMEALLKAKKLVDEDKIEKRIPVLSHFSRNESVEIAKLTLKGGILNQIGVLFDFIGDFEQAINNFVECRNIAFAIDDKALLSLVHMNMGGIYLLTNQLDSAISLEEKALEFAEESKFLIYKGYILYVFGQSYLAKGHVDLSKKYFKESVIASMDQETLTLAGLGNLGLADLFQKTNDLDSSLYYARKGLDMQRHSANGQQIVRTYTLLSSIYKNQNKIDSAFYYQKLSIDAKDSLQGVEQTKRLEEIRFDEQLRTRELESEKLRIKNNIRLYSSLAAFGVFLVISFILYRNNKNKKRANNALQESLANLKTTQSQLIQSEKMASLGELTAGIAHEIQNPLNFVNNFSDVSADLIEEMNEEIALNNHDEVKEIAHDIKSNLEKIRHHGQRASGIVKGMLEHSRTGDGIKERTDINALADEYLRLAYHGLRAKDKSFNADFKTDFDQSIQKIDLISQDIGRVLLNLINNAFYAVSEKAKQKPEYPEPVEGSEGDNTGLTNHASTSSAFAKDEFRPLVTISTRKLDDHVKMTVSDNGSGIPEQVRDKIFQPFFTTKPTGSGTGLGLSLSYDIVKAHGGEIKVESEDGKGTNFIIKLPIV